MPSSTPPQVPPPSLQPLPTSLSGQSTRIDLGEIKSQICKRLGPERAKKYFGHLQRFLSSSKSKPSKPEFDKLCLTALGHENLHLHNHLIRSILHNACLASGPPAINAAKPIGGSANSTAVPISPIAFWGNGDVPNQHVKDCHPQSRRAVPSTQQPSMYHDEAVTRINGVPHLGDLKRRAQFQQGELVEPVAKRSRVEKISSDILASVHCNGPVGVVPTGDWEENAQYAQGPVHAPLGIPFCPASFGGVRKPLAPPSNGGSGSCISCYESGELCDTGTLRKRMEQIVEAEGLGGASIDSANLLNSGMDVFLKRLIKSCVELVGARSRHDRINHVAPKQQLSRKLINGVWLQNHLNGQSGSTPFETNSISLQDFKAVVELNPQLLGVNSSLLLEKINLSD